MRVRSSPLEALTLATLVLLTLAACDEDLPRATEIARMRLLGAKVEVVGDETRATPKPGEAIDLSFVSVHPTLAGTSANAQTLLVSCTQPTRYTGGLPVCQEFLDIALGGEVDAMGALGIASKLRCLDLSEGVYEVGTVSIRCIDGDRSARIDVSPAFAGAEMLYRGVVCERGQAYIDPFDPSFFGCDDNDGESFLVHGTVTIQHDANLENHNPDLDRATFYLGTPETSALGRAWPLLATDELPAEHDCVAASEAAGFPAQRNDGDYKITVHYDPSARELVDGMPEDVEFSMFATAGELERRFVVFESMDELKDGVLEGTLNWTPPKEIEGRIQLVRFFFTVLDRRGGFDWTSRVLCLR